MTTEEFRFTAPDRKLGEEDRLELTSVGVDIGSSTSHLIFSRLVLERVGNRYITVDRQVLGQSDILLTPYVNDQTTIDGDALGRFIDQQYTAAGLEREDVDTGALILTGVALMRENARAIAELFASETGKFVAVSAGDNLEATLAAMGSGAATLSTEGHGPVLNIDIGGGTTKLAFCEDGRVLDVAAIDIGARLVVAENGVVTRLEESGRNIGKELGIDLHMGGPVTPEQMQAIAGYMADKLYEIVTTTNLSPGAQALMRTQQVEHTGRAKGFSFSGGVSEFIYGREPKSFGDLGQMLGAAIRQKMESAGAKVYEPAAGIRATVIGASQYTVQVSGSTIFLSPVDAVPVRNVPVVSPSFELSGDEVDQEKIAGAITSALTRLDMLETESPIALALRWEGSATYGRIDSFCQGVIAGMQKHLDKGYPLVLVFEGDVGGLLGIHIKQELHFPGALISIDGIELKEFDFIDIGAIIPTSGAVPVVIKSLVFPTGSK